LISYSITAQATRSPAFPEGWLTWSSAPAWSIRVRPRIPSSSPSSVTMELKTWAPSTPSSATYWLGMSPRGVPSMTGQLDRGGTVPPENQCCWPAFLSADEREGWRDGEGMELRPARDEGGHGLPALGAPRRGGGPRPSRKRPALTHEPGRGRVVHAGGAGTGGWRALRL